MNLGEYSRLTTAIRVTGWCFRFSMSMKAKKAGKGCLTQQEYCNALLAWIKHCQQEFYGDLLHDIKTRKPNQYVAQLGAKLDEDGNL